MTDSVFWIDNSMEPDKFLDTRICELCLRDFLVCHCYDTYDDMLLETPNIQKELEVYCSGCLFDERYCECWKDEWNFTSDMNDFNPFPEADEFPYLFAEQHCYWFPRRHELSKGDTSWKRQVRVVKQWARHAHRIAKNVKPLDLLDYLVIRDFVYPD